MTSDDFKNFLENLQSKTLKLAHYHKVEICQIERDLAFHSSNFRGYVSDYDSSGRCLAYALRYGLKTAYQTWLNLKNAAGFKKTERIVIVGGGCAFELPVLLKFLASEGKHFKVTIIDKHADSWKIFIPLHLELAQEMGIQLEVEYLQNADVVDQIDKLKPDLLVASNMLNELNPAEVQKLSIPFIRLPYFVQDLHYGKMKALLKVYIEETVNEPFPKISRVPGMSDHGNLERRTFCDTKGFIKPKSKNVSTGNS